MRILWITNILLPPISKAINTKASPTGGWMYSSLKCLIEYSSHEFAIATVYKGKEIVEERIDGVTYYLIPDHGSMTNYHLGLEKEWKIINERFNPDVVHIHGSEYQHGHAWVNACGNQKVILSIQGILSAYYRFLPAGIPSDAIPKLNLRTILHYDSWKQMLAKWDERGKTETEYLKKINNYIGRTEWDKAHCWALNPKARYFYCSETLRSEFYLHKWDYSRCEPNTIFLSQAGYSIKGLHKLLEALKFVVREFPNVKVKIAGQNILNTKWYKKSVYALYIEKLIRKFGLKGKIYFLGPLDEKQMVQEYLKANLFICPSSIENSPNSVGEAQLLGMPILATYAGGTNELLEMNQEQLYRFEEVEMLAHKICRIFSQKDKYTVPTYNLKRYDKKDNAETLLRIYHEIANSPK